MRQTEFGCCTECGAFYLTTHTCGKLEAAIYRRRAATLAILGELSEWFHARQRGGFFELKCRKCSVRFRIPDSPYYALEEAYVHTRRHIPQLRPSSPTTRSSAVRYADLLTLVSDNLDRYRVVDREYSIRAAHGDRRKRHTKFVLECLGCGEEVEVRSDEAMDYKAILIAHNVSCDAEVQHTPPSTTKGGYTVR